MLICFIFFSFFFNDTAPTDIYTLSLHDALPICLGVYVRQALRSDVARHRLRPRQDLADQPHRQVRVEGDRKSTRLNSSHANISYAVFCLKKKKKKKKNQHRKKTLVNILQLRWRI